MRHARTACACLAAITLGACGDDPVAPVGPPDTTGSSITWRRERGGLGVDSIRSVWAASSSHVFLLHDDGIVAYRAPDWSVVTVADDTPPLAALWGASATSLHVVGNGGTLLQSDGSTTFVMQSPTTADLCDVSGASADAVHAVGNGTAGASGVVLRFDGDQWTVARGGIDANLRGVWSGPDGHVVVVGGAGFITQYDGVTWTTPDTGVDDHLNDVWGASPADIYAVGEGGRVLHFDGAGWSVVPLSTSSALHAVHGTTGADVDIVGEGGELHHFDGVSWSLRYTGTSNRLRAIHRPLAGGGIAAGDAGTVLAAGSVAWAPLFDGEPFTFERVWMWSGANYMAVGSAGAGGVAQTLFGETWYFPAPLHAVSGFAFDDQYAVGDAGSIVRFNGDAWTPDISGTNAHLRAISSLVTRLANPFRLYAVGDDGTILIWRVGAWHPATVPAGAEAFDFVDVWAAAIDDVFAVASNSTSIVRYDDPFELAQWTLETTPATAPLRCVGGWRGDVFIASAAGEIFRNRGSGWIPMTSPVTTPLHDLHAVSESSVYACGDGGVVLHYDGTRWRRTRVPYLGSLRGLWGDAGNWIYAAGEQGAVFSYEETPLR